MIEQEKDPFDKQLVHAYEKGHKEGFADGQRQQVPPQWPPLNPMVITHVPCDHCFCQSTSVGLIPHMSCCMCGTRKQAVR